MGKELNPQNDVTKDQDKFFKVQMNVNNNSRKDDIKKEDIKIDNGDHSYIGDEYKGLIVDTFKFRLKRWRFESRRI